LFLVRRTAYNPAMRHRSTRRATTSSSQYSPGLDFIELGGATQLNHNFDNKGFAGGGQTGCQLQTGTFLWGLEGDWSSFGNSSSENAFAGESVAFIESLNRSQIPLSRKFCTVVCGEQCSLTWPVTRKPTTGIACCCALAAIGDAAAAPPRKVMNSRCLMQSAADLILAGMDHPPRLVLRQYPCFAAQSVWQGMSATGES
jgi:hypothetical protein